MLFSSLALLPALFLVAAEAKKSGKATKTCTDAANAFVVIENGLDKYKEIFKRQKNVTFAVTVKDVADKAKAIEKVQSKSSRAGFALKYDKDETKELNKQAKKSSKIKKIIKRHASTFEDTLEKSLKLVILHKKASAKLIKAFKSRGIRAIAANRKVDSKSAVSKVLKKINEKEEEAGIIFVRADKVKSKKLKTLFKGLGDKVVRRSGCFKAEMTESEIDSKKATDTEGEECAEESTDA
jgi:hypothetical protein